MDSKLEAMLTLTTPLILVFTISLVAHIASYLSPTPPNVSFIGLYCNGTLINANYIPADETCIAELDVRTSTPTMVRVWCDLPFAPDVVLVAKRVPAGNHVVSITVVAPSKCRTVYIIVDGAEPWEKRFVVGGAAKRN